MSGPSRRDDGTEPTMGASGPIGGSDPIATAETLPIHTPSPSLALGATLAAPGGSHLVAVDGPPTDAPPPVTRETEGHYVSPPGGPVVLGVGGLGRVTLVHDRHLERDVALKEMLDPTNAAMVSRFLREARVTARLEHPSIVPVHELGIRADGTIYYTMKRVRGRTLAAALRSARGTADRLALLPRFAALCQAIAFAHSHGVVHRDIKTDNVMLGEFGETQVLDWGIARVGGADSEQRDDAHAESTPGAGQTVAGEILGTPAYMSPEQAAGDLARIDARSDVWSLGVVLYELLTGRMPIAGESAPELLWNVRNAAVEPIRETDTLPAEIVSICRKALSPEPAQRYPDAGAMAREIEAYLTGIRVASHEYTAWEILQRFARQNRAALLAAAAIALVVVVGLVVVSLSYARESRARRQAEHATRLAQRAQVSERHERQIADFTIAQGAVDRAVRLVDDRQWPWARVYAAAALVHYPLRGATTAARAAFEREVPGAEATRLEAESLLRQAERDDPLRLEVERSAGEPLAALEYAPDGALLAAAGFDGRVVVWDTATHAEVARYLAHRGGTYALAFSPDSRRLATAGVDGVVDVRDARTGSIERSLPGHTGAVWGLAFAPDGARLVSGSDDGTVRAWALDDGRSAWSFDGHGGTVRTVSFSPDGTRVLSGGRDRLVRLHDAATGAPVQTYAGATDRIEEVAFSPDGATVAACGNDKRVRVWDARSGTIAWASADLGDEVYSLAFSRDGRWIAAGGYDHALRLFEARTGRLVTALPAHASALFGVRFSPDGHTIATASDDRRVRLWRFEPTPWLVSEARYVWSLAWSPDGGLLAIAHDDGVLELWDPAGPTRIASLHGSASGLRGVAFSPTGDRLVTAGSDAFVGIWDVAQRTEIRALRGHTNKVSGVAFAPDGRSFASASFDGTLRIWDVADGRLVRVISASEQHAHLVCYTPDGQTLLSGGSDGLVNVWDARTGTLQRSLHAGTDIVYGLLLSPDGTRLYTASFDGSIIVWDLATGRQLATRRTLHGNPTALALSRDGHWLAAGTDDKMVFLWNETTGQMDRALRLSQSVLAIAFAPDGRAIAVGDGTDARVYPLAEGAPTTSPDENLATVERWAGAHLDGLVLTVTH